MSRDDQIKAVPLTKSAFEEFGSVIEKTGSENFAINNGNCIRHHHLATCEASGKGGQIGISIFSGKPYPLPLTLEMVERHPLGSQAFYPLGDKRWLVIVCQDSNGSPINPVAFLASANQGINLKPGVWHGVLTPLGSQGDFLIVDRIGDGENLEEHHFDVAFSVSI